MWSLLALWKSYKAKECRCLEILTNAEVSYERGSLFIKFDVKFPENHFADEETIKKIEALLPARPKIEIPEGEMVEEVNMDDYVPSRREEGGSRGGGHAYQEDDDDDDDGPRGGPGVQCASQ